MSELPTGTVTFLFTDIEGSTRLLQRLGDGYDEVQGQHGAILRRAISEGNGTEIRTEGDSFFAVFRNPGGAVRAVVTAQRSLAEHPWPHDVSLRVRMGMHTGEGRTAGSGTRADYVGIDVNRAARIAAAAHGGQVLLSEATRTLVERSLPEGVTTRDQGAHRLKDIEHPERLYDLVIDGQQADFPPIRTLATPTNFPPERSSFVGREKEIEDVSRLLGHARLVTLTGPGGTGKTRLSQRVAGGLLDRFPDGVFLVDLSPIVDPELVPSAIAVALRVREQAGRGLLDTLQDHLRDRSVLLVLDNLEQVIAAAATVGRLLDAAPNLSVLATSRVPLHLSGEQEYPVPPLSLPGRKDDLETLSRCEAVRLFAERAAQVQPSFRLTDDTVQVVAEIASRLDGLPLAIELAASRLKLLDPAALLARLERRLPLLTGGARDLPERQRTLRGAIEWSQELLRPEDRRLFARVSVFAGGWALEAAEVVCGGPDGDDVLDGMDALVDGSLVQRRDTSDGGVRFRMLDTIREFAAERLAESEEEADVHRRHAEHVRDFAEAAEPHLIGEDQQAWLDRLEREHDNLRAALRWAADSGDAETGLRTAAAVWRFWQLRAHLAGGRAHVEALLALPAAQGRDAVRARGLGALGSIAYWQGDYGLMVTAYEEAAAIAREVGDSGLIAHALFDLSFVPMLEGDLDRQEALSREALGLAAEHDVRLIADIWVGLGFLEVFRGNPAGAIEPIERAVDVERGLGDRNGVAESLTALAGARYLSGDTEAGKSCLRESFAIQAELKNRMGLAALLVPVALVANREGRYRPASVLLGAWAKMLEDLGGGAPTFALLPLFGGDGEPEARRDLGDAEYERARAEGFAMSLDEAVALAFEELK